MPAERNGARPVVAADVWVAPTAQVVGDVTLGEGTSPDGTPLGLPHRRAAATLRAEAAEWIDTPL